MKQVRPRGIRVGSSDPNRLNDLKENHKLFEEMRDNGWEITSTRVRRPRIKNAVQPKAVVVTLGGEWTVTLSYADYQKRGDGLKIVMKIY